MSDQSKSIHQFKVKLINGAEKNLSAYKNKVLLIVNIASACGFAPQLKDLQELREQFGTEHFEVLAFPSNDFGRQEPLEGAAIGNFCEANYGVHFPVFEKIMVRGEQAHPLFKFLTQTATPRWNFHKYLVNKEGEVVDYFFPFTKPLSSKVKKKIQRLL
ncbi:MULTISPECIES: glutathione peroxidase [Pedobacter]|uniref:Glutathione peroxidase n=1 Tax=Pedobacter heparinus (strain ATCC 13125 / DSM 2366 / CIP 104194 / JCM 7457 / NBRC 12017 / NCIMB 9290 / NRRL B-14731 / HIM 762-3) TaxID=485917 RepID=C6XS80_PEDHD|nr:MULTISPECIES: glutathione peroxidase [Pedobacter]ACU03425.1 glutathione peroxidase [Pedobacter heparinus DSM 2366]MBB5439097.1 glutathione peroxidase [Pedobacter sp. AK017]